MYPHTPEIQALVRFAHREDSASADVTTRTLIKPSWRVEAKILSKQHGVVAGLELAKALFLAFDSTLRFRPLVREGAVVRPGQAIALIKGRATSVLSAERAALNALQHLSGIATFARDQVRKLKGTRTQLYDTRKTLPGWRQLQKYAVRAGGARNHRMTLADEVMIKENHLKVARLAKSNWLMAMRRFRTKYPRTLVQMEIQTNQDLQDALLLQPRRVLLDNFGPQVLRRLIPFLRQKMKGVEIEITGGVQPGQLRTLARLGADRISMGRLTHSVKAFDCSLDITHVHS